MIRHGQANKIHQIHSKGYRQQEQQRRQMRRLERRLEHRQEQRQHDKIDGTFLKEIRDDRVGKRIGKRSIDDILLVKKYSLFYNRMLRISSFR